jgi:hypothetical protein
VEVRENIALVITASKYSIWFLYCTFKSLAE